LLEPVSYINITTDDQLEAFCTRLTRAEWVAFDTEFVAERSYRPQLCLVQVATSDQMAIIDPMTIDDMTPFWQAIVADGHETIVHAGRGEFEFCLRAVGRRPANLFDVQIAAGMVGVEYPAGFGTLLVKLLGETPGKLETRTDWRRRPLSERQVQYALDDVRHLSALRHKLHARLEELRRLDWMQEEMEMWQQTVESGLLEERWRRVSGISGLGQRSLAIVRELWRWREAVAERRDCPTRRVLRDDLIIELAKRQTAEVKRIRAVRGMERGDLKRQLPRIADAIKRALALPEEQLPTRIRREPMPQLPVLGQFLFSALGSICRQADLSPGLVGTPSDVRELVVYHAGQRKTKDPPLLARGWRAQVVGKTFDALLAGQLAIRIEDPLSEHPLVFEGIDQ
jgi:ribonuclease D